MKRQPDSMNGFAPTQQSRSAPSHDAPKSKSGVEINNLCALAYAQGFTLFHYRSHKDTLNTIMGQHYFSDAWEMIKIGDCIFLVGIDGVKLAYVCARDVGTVSVAAT